jgi:hypothetical protein
MLPICEYPFISIGWELKTAASLKKYHYFCPTSELKVPIQFSQNPINSAISIYYESGTGVALVVRHSINQDQTP